MKFPGKGYPWKNFFVDLKNEYQKDRVGDAAGALTYFGVLALFPFLLFLVSLASLIIDPQQASALVEQLGQVAPAEVTSIVGAQIRTLGENQNVGLLTLGAIGALWSASSGVGAVMRALNTAYDVEETRPFWKVRGIALLFTLGGGVLGVLAALAMVALPGVANSIGGVVGTWITWLRIPVAGVLVMFAWAVAYWALPDVEQRFKFITPGSVVGVIIWVLASLAFSFYVSNFGKYNATYGALGAVIVLLLWLWISSQVLIIGAEINSLIEHASPEGKNVGEKTLQGAEVRSGGAVPSRYGEGKSTEEKLRAAARERQQAGVEEGGRAGGQGARRPEPAAGKRWRLAFWGALLGAAVIEGRRQLRSS